MALQLLASALFGPQQMTLSNCPICGSAAFVPKHGRREMEFEIALRSRFVSGRLDHKPQPTELMDLTTFMHGGPEPILACSTCGLTMRDEPDKASYPDDVYDRDLLAHLYPRYLAAFRDKARQCVDALPARADVVEVGCHLGAFLQAAEEQAWKPVGLDVGECTSDFCRRSGMRVKRNSIEDAPFANHSMDAVFIWNCFEQLENPVATLRAAHRLLKRHGVLVVRAPNFGFYETSRRLARKKSRRGPALRALAYNNLLGFPYLTGYNPALLTSFVGQQGFQPVKGFSSTVITMPFADPSRKAQEESAAVNAPYRNSIGNDPAALQGPWIEILYRRRDG
jgi:SAM-dependent methyltransferase